MKSQENSKFLKRNEDHSVQHCLPMLFDEYPPSSHSNGMKPSNVKWSPSKQKSKKIVAEHNLLKIKGKKTKNDSNINKFVAIYSNSNACKPKLN
jgi:hypothetical protein